MRLYKVKLGNTVITRNAINELDPHAVQVALARHESGDWGDADLDEKAKNDAGYGDLHSVYNDLETAEFWIITNSERTETKVMLPEDDHCTTEAVPIRKAYSFVLQRVSS